MYILVVGLTMLVLPVASILVEHGFQPTTSVIVLVGRWFVFWGIGVRLALAGFRQFFQPEFTARKIFHMRDDEALPIVRELGVTNIAAGVVGLISVGVPSFVLPAAISAGIFYGVAGVRHVAERERSRNENVAMISDLFIAIVLVVYICAAVLKV